MYQVLAMVKSLTPGRTGRAVLQMLLSDVSESAKSEHLEMWKWGMGYFPISPSCLCSPSELGCSPTV